MIPECANKWVFVSISVSYAFPWVFSCGLLFLCYSNLFVFVLSYYILFCYYPIDACLFSNRKGIHLDEREGGEELGGVD